MERPTEISGKTGLSRKGRATLHGRMKGPRYGEEPPVRRKRPWGWLGLLALVLAAGSYGALAGPFAAETASAHGP